MKDERKEKRIFSYDEAAAMLPEVRRLTEEAHRAVEELGGEGGPASSRSARSGSFSGKTAETLMFSRAIRSK